MKTLLHLLILSCSINLALAEKSIVFQGEKGILVMESESTQSKLGSWKKKKDVPEFSGECHLEFTGNKITNGPPNSPLEYNFTVDKDGVYTLVLKARKRLETKREDLSNDCFVSLKGDFQAAGNVPKKLLETPTKMFGGAADSWGWARKLDDKHTKYDPKYKLIADKQYTLTIHGRSKNFNLDNIMFVHESVPLKTALKNQPKESKQTSKN